MAKYTQEEKDAYLKYYKKKGPSKNTLTFGKWRSRRKEVNSRGGSRQMKQQSMGLSKGDYAELSKFLKK